MPEQENSRKKPGRPKGKPYKRKTGYKSYRNRKPLDILKMFTQRQCALYMDLSEPFTRKLISDGVLASVQSGNRKYVPKSAADAWLASFGKPKPEVA